MRVMVVGGCGFIGTHLCRALTERGDEVTVVDRDEWTGGCAEHLGPDSTIGQQDLVYHLAAQGNVHSSHADHLRDTLLSTAQVLDWMVRTGTRRIVFTSSGTVYGEGPMPFREGRIEALPISVYGACKLGSEALLSSYAEQEGIEPTILRLANVVGPGLTRGLLYVMRQRLRENPERVYVEAHPDQGKPFLHVDDTVRALLTAQEWPGRVVNIAPHNDSTPLRDVLDLIADRQEQATGLRPEVEWSGNERAWPGDVRQTRFDCRLAHSLGWTASMSSHRAVWRAIEELWEKA